MQGLPPSASPQGKRPAAAAPPAPDLVSGTGVAPVRQAEQTVGSRGPAPSATPLGQRQIEVPPAERVPDAAELEDALRTVGFPVSLELGVAADLPAPFLLSLAPQQDPRWLLRQTLQAALPLQMDTLDKALQEPCLRARHIAETVAEWGIDKDVTQVLPDDDALLDKLVELLSPIAENSWTLAVFLEIDRPARQHLKQMLQEGLTSDSQAAILARACEAQPRTRAQWLPVLACAGMDNLQMKRLAALWQLEPQEPLEGTLERYWYDYIRSCTAPKILCDQIVDQQAQQPQAPVPLSLVWPLIAKGSMYREAALLALDDASQPLYSLNDQYRQRVLFSLLSCAAREGAEGLGDKHLRQLAACRCVPRQLVDPLSADKAEPESASRPLRPSDLVRLSQERVEERGWGRGQEPERKAMEVAVLLGVGCRYAELKGQFPGGYAQVELRAMEIWRQIYNAVPGLETGHLALLFRQFAMPELVEPLTGDPAFDRPPTVPLDSLAWQAQKCVDRVAMVWSRPAWEISFCYPTPDRAHNALVDAPENTSLACRLINYRLITGSPLVP